MVTFTTNKALGLPTVGGDTGVWGQPLNNNSSVLDASLGGIAIVPISSVSGAITLLASNYNNVFLVFSGALTQNTVVTLPTVGSFYYMKNITTGSSQFVVTVTSTGSATSLGLQPGKIQGVFSGATTMEYFGIPDIGSYWDYAGSSVPAWVSACTTPPWLNCDGTSFSSATYPNLANILGGNTLPDSRGRTRFSLNQATGRITSTAGLDGNTLLAGGGVQATAIATSHLPSSALNEPSSGHTHVTHGSISGSNFAPYGSVTDNITQYTGNVDYARTGITFGSTNPSPFPTIPPGYVGGLTLIRAG